MFPYIKLTLMDGGVMWIRHETIAQVYYDEDDNTTTISSISEDHDFSVRESVDEVLDKIRVFYNNSPSYQPSLSPYTESHRSINPYDPEPTINGGW